MLARDFAWKSGGFAGIYHKCPTCLLMRAQKIDSDWKYFPSFTVDLCIPRTSLSSRSSFTWAGWQRELANQECLRESCFLPPQYFQHWTNLLSSCLDIRVLPHKIGCISHCILYCPQENGFSHCITLPFQSAEQFWEPSTASLSQLRNNCLPMTAELQKSCTKIPPDTSIVRAHGNFCS